MSPLKLGFFGVTSFGLYVVWWFWSQWRAEAPNDSRWSAALKTVFAAFFFYPMARDVKEAAAKKGVTCRYSPAVLTGLMWATAIAVRLLPEPGQAVAAFFIPAPLLRCSARAIR